MAKLLRYQEDGRENDQTNTPLASRPRQWLFEPMVKVLCRAIIYGLMKKPAVYLAWLFKAVDQDITEEEIGKRLVYIRNSIHKRYSRNAVCLLLKQCDQDIWAEIEGATTDEPKEDS